MATMADFLANLNTGLGNITGTPLGQFGMNMLANSGYRPDNAGLGQRLGQSLQGMQDMQQTQAQTQLRQVQAMQAMQEMRKLKAEQDAQQKQQDYFSQNPNALSQFPTANTMAQAGVANLAPYIKADTAAQPTRQAIYSRQNPDNTMTQMVWDAPSGAYKEGATTFPVSQQQVNATVQNNQANQDLRQAGLNIQQQNAETAKAQQQIAQQRADAVTQEAQRQAAASIRTNNIAKGTLDVGYNGTKSQMDKQIGMIDDLLADKSMGRAFGWTGQAPTAPGSDAARIEAKLAQLRGNAGLTGLTQLKQMGIALTPVSDNDMRVASESTMSLSNRMSEADARNVLTNYRKQLETTREEAGKNYDIMARGYETPTTPAQQQQAGPPRIGDDASYNALPSGTEFIGPDGQRRRKP